MSLEKSRALSRADKQKSSGFSIGDTVSFGGRGVYRIDNIENMDFGGKKQKFYSLTQVYSKTIHRTLVGEGTKDMASLRHTITAEEFFAVGEVIEDLAIVPVDFSWNSNRKLQEYSDWMAKDGFWGLLRTFLATTIDCQKNPKVDKRVKAFNAKLRSVIVEEVANALGIDLLESEEKLKNIFFNQFN